MRYAKKNAYLYFGYFEYEENQNQPRSYCRGPGVLGRVGLFLVRVSLSSAPPGTDEPVRVRRGLYQPDLPGFRLAGPLCGRLPGAVLPVSRGGRAHRGAAADGNRRGRVPDLPEVPGQMAVPGYCLSVFRLVFPAGNGQPLHYPVHRGHAGVPVPGAAGPAVPESLAPAGRRRAAGRVRRLGPGLPVPQALRQGLGRAPRRVRPGDRPGHRDFPRELGQGCPATRFSTMCRTTSTPC